MCYRNERILKILPASEGLKTDISFNIYVMTIAVGSVELSNYKVMSLSCVGAFNKQIRGNITGTKEAFEKGGV